MGYIQKEVNEKYIKDLTILKLKRNYDFIEREEYKQELKALVESHGFSDYAELLSFTAFNVIFNRIEDMQDENVKVIFNEEVEVPDGEDYIPKTCDVILIGKDEMEVISILPLNDNVIWACNSKEIKLLAIGAIDKYLSRIECSKIKIITIQPNLDLCSIYETSIERILHEYDFTLLDK